MTNEQEQANNIEALDTSNKGIVGRFALVGIAGLVAWKLSKQENRQALQNAVEKTISGLRVNLPFGAVGILAILEKAGFQKGLLEQILQQENGFEYLAEIVTDAINKYQLERNLTSTCEPVGTSTSRKFSEQELQAISQKFKEFYSAGQSVTFEDYFKNFKLADTVTGDAWKEVEIIPIEELKRLHDELLSPKTQLQSETKLQTEEPVFVMEDEVDTQKRAAAESSVSEVAQPITLNFSFVIPNLFGKRPN